MTHCYVVVCNHCNSYRVLACVCLYLREIVKELGSLNCSCWLHHLDEVFSNPTQQAYRLSLITDQWRGADDLVRLP